MCKLCVTVCHTAIFTRLCHTSACKALCKMDFVVVCSRSFVVVFAVKSFFEVGYLFHNHYVHTAHTHTYTQSDSFDRLEIQFDFAAQTFPPNGSLAHFTILIIENDLGGNVLVCVCMCNKTYSLARSLAHSVWPYAYTNFFSIAIHEFKVFVSII